MNNNTVIYESDNYVATIYINRPAKLNSINADVEKQLTLAWQKFEYSNDRVAILTGAGHKAFSAGKDLESSEPPDFTRFTPNIGVPLSKPVIASVSGYCIGGAIGLVQMCDLCVVTETAKFIYPEPKLGFSGGLITSLPTRIPHKVAMELMLLGEEISGQRMYDIGFANRIVPACKHMSEAYKMANILVENAPLVVSMLKEFAEQCLVRSAVEHTGYANRTINRIFESDDYKEGLSSAREKRSPKFQGK